MTRNRVVFVDSSVLIAAAISSKGSARELFNAVGDQIDRLALNSYVLEETARNLASKVPAALATYHELVSMDLISVIEIDKSMVLTAAEAVETKDAPIVAGAVAAGPSHLV